jgi:transcriptional regulator with XRE-family HTH domain
MIGEKLRKLRKERGWTQKTLEEKTGVAQRNISSYESGKLQPSARTLRKFADAFEVPVEELVGEPRKEAALVLSDPELLQMFREVSQLPEAEQNRLKWVISLALRNNRLQQVMAS